MSKISKAKDHHRSDYGSVLATPRDIEILTIAAHHSIIRKDHIHQLLSRHSGGPLRDPENGLSDNTVRDQIDRWKRAGWILYDRVLAGESGYAWVTKAGLRLVGLDRLYKDVRPPSVLRFHHYWAVLDVRLNWWSWDEDEPVEPGVWIPERRLRAEMLTAKKIDPDHIFAPVRLDVGVIPDAVVVARNGTWVDAIEVQLSPLKPGEMREKVERLCQATYYHVERDKEYIYNEIHFYVPSDGMKKSIERAAANLSEKDRERIVFTVDQEYARLKPYSL